MNFGFLIRFRGLAIFLLLAAIVTVLALLVYASVQQVYRSGANDPQIEASEQVADFLNQKIPPEAIVGNNQIDFSKSLSLFVIIYDKDGKVVASSGKLEDKEPAPPAGVFDFAKSHGSSNFTWQPKEGVRIAAVMRKVSDEGGFVLVGRNLREIEKRSQNLVKMVGMAWIILLVLCAFLAWLLKRTLSVTNVEETNVLVVEENSKL